MNGYHPSIEASKNCEIDVRCALRDVFPELQSRSCRAALALQLPPSCWILARFGSGIQNQIRGRLRQIATAQALKVSIVVQVLSMGIVVGVPLKICLLGKVIATKLQFPSTLLCPLVLLVAVVVLEAVLNPI